MKVTCVTVYVKPQFVEDFIQATVENHLNSLKEAGNLRFDFLQSLEDPARFFLYEAYDNDEAAAAHKSTIHYQKWKQAVDPWMAKPREGIAHRVVMPKEAGQW